ncbi:MAG TPA: M1 family aminopeptidase [Saprospiraceae bacterium]|nr:M1 family aminopeptidase [Saprospiraceae bacterium]HMQ81501.1 M1 family aminopeptidase [Saprospiraceae bacterium]
MKAYFKLLLFLSLLIGKQSIAQNTPLEEAHQHCNKALTALNETIQTRGLSSFEDLSYDLHYYRLEWEIDPAIYAIAGTATAYFEAKEDALSSLEFNLSTQLVIDAIHYHGMDISFAQTGDYGLSVFLPTPLASGTLDSLSITYHGSPPSGGFGSFIQSSHSGMPVLWTLSEPFGSQDWWPCKNGLTDKLDSLDIFVTTPAQYRAASNGLLRSEITFQDGRKRYHWQHHYPIATYLVAVAVTNYTQYTNMVPLSNGAQLPMVNYVYPESLTDAQNGTEDLIQVLQFFDSLFVGYPFAEEKYGHAQFSWGGGMEHQTMSFVNSYGWTLLSHELAHQWFGDMVTCGSWEDIWLNEGFATYLEGLSRERFPEQIITQWYNWKLEKLNSITSQPGGSVRVDDTTSVSRIFSSRLSYYKGAYLLNMLRWKLGDAAFFQGIRNYLIDRQHNFARTSQLKSHLEVASDQDLEAFFADWFVGEGYPSYQINWSQDLDNQLSIIIHQTQSHASVSYFEMPLPLRLIGSNGERKDIVLDHTWDGQIFQEQVDFTVASVLFDPDLWLISKNNTVQHGAVGTSNLATSGFDLQLKPNPVLGSTIRLIATAPTSGQLLFSLQDAAGRLIFSHSAYLTQGENNLTFDLDHLTAGTYIISMKNEVGKLSRQVQIQ